MMKTRMNLRFHQSTTLGFKSKEENLACFEYYKGLISLRKAHPAFRMANAEDVIDNVRFLYEDVEGIIAIRFLIMQIMIRGTILIIHNNCNKQLVTLTLPLEYGT